MRIQERTVVIGGAVVIALVVVAGVVVQVRSASRPRPAVAAAPAPVAGTGERIQTISTGEEVDLPAYLPEQGRTVVEFTAEW